LRRAVPVAGEDGEAALPQRPGHGHPVVGHPLEHPVGGAVVDVDDLLPAAQTVGEELRCDLPQLFVADRNRDGVVDAAAVLDRRRHHASRARASTSSNTAPSNAASSNTASRAGHCTSATRAPGARPGWRTPKRMIAAVNGAPLRAPAAAAPPRRGAAPARRWPGGGRRRAPPPWAP